MLLSTFMFMSNSVSKPVAVLVSTYVPVPFQVLVRMYKYLVQVQPTIMLWLLLIFMLLHNSMFMEIMHMFISCCIYSHFCLLVDLPKHVSLIFT
jgi:hypothetical protein